MDVYQHDGPRTFRFVVKGALVDTSAKQLECAWKTAQSILRDKTVSIDISEVTVADCAALDLLMRMRASGARILAASPPQCKEVVRLLDHSAAESDGRDRMMEVWATTVGHLRSFVRRRFHRMRASQSTR